MIVDDETFVQMAHAMGFVTTRTAVTDRPRESRNHYVTRSDCPIWCALVIRGLATEVRSRLIGEGMSFFVLTRAARRAVFADPRSSPVEPACSDPEAWRPPKPVRTYEVRFEGEPHPSSVGARSHSHARYLAAEERGYHHFEPTFVWLKKVESVRLERSAL